MANLPDSIKVLMKMNENVGYSVNSIPLPKPGPCEVLIKVHKVAICGSDINMWTWNDTAKVIAKIPFIPGHEATGEVVAVGSDVRAPKLGDRICVENHYFCGECFQCKDGRGDICQKMSQYGHGKGTDQGGCGQYSIVPAKYCYILQTDITPNQAVLLEPMGVAHNAVDVIGVRGENVLVLGCGPVGLMAISICKSLGAKAVIGLDSVSKRLELAKKMGADGIIDGVKQDTSKEVSKLTDGNGMGRIIEASGAAFLLNQAFGWLRKGGGIALIGLPKSPLHVENVLTDVVFKSITLKSVHGRRIFSTWQKCESLLSSGKVDIMPIVSHDMPMKDYAKAFDLLISGDACKIVMDPQNI